jgi:hypothetical protein
MKKKESSTMITPEFTLQQYNVVTCILHGEILKGDADEELKTAHAELERAYDVYWKKFHGMDDDDFSAYRDMYKKRMPLSVKP